jgi:hypothetical protein
MDYINIEFRLCNSNNKISTNNFLPVNPQSKKHSFINLAGQAFLGSAFEVGFSILPLAGAFSTALSGRSSKTTEIALSVLAVSVYLFGAAVGVHLIAKAENSDLSLWPTFGYSIIGGGVGVLLISFMAAQYKTIPTYWIVTAALSPVIGSMVYASFIADWPQHKD